MTVIIADTGPVNYLVLIGSIDLLGKLADKVVLPSSVRTELLHERAPQAVRAWAQNPPGWIEVRTATQLIEAPDIAPADREAITLARELNATVLLMDDQQGRGCATRLGVATIGTLGLLEAGAARDLVSLPDAVEKLRQTSCYLSDEVVERVIHRNAQRRRAREIGESEG